MANLGLYREDDAVDTPPLVTVLGLSANDAKTLEDVYDGVLDGVECIEHEGYPMLIPGDDTISGEVYRVNAEQLLTLDAYEEAPEVYARVERQLARRLRLLANGLQALLAKRTSVRPKCASGDLLDARRCEVHLALA